MISSQQKGEKGGGELPFLCTLLTRFTDYLQCQVLARHYQRMPGGTLHNKVLWPNPSQTLNPEVHALLISIFIG